MRISLTFVTLGLLLTGCPDDTADTGSGGDTDTSTGTDSPMTLTTTTQPTTTTMTTDAPTGTGDVTGMTQDDNDTTVTDSESSTTESVLTMDSSTSTTDDPTAESSSSESSSSESSSSESSSSDGDPPPPPDCLDDGDCADGLVCTGAETCVNGACVPGNAVMCPPDMIACTVEMCSEAAMGCVSQPMNGMCPAGQTCNPNTGCQQQVCVPTPCQNATYDCGDCIDNDGDGAIDLNDVDCFGPCDDNETGWAGLISGQQNQNECLTMDCYFDNDSGPGGGSDGCVWSQTCDPLSPSGCTYNPNTNIPGAGGGATCAGLFMTQSNQCHNICEPIVPNGCDCFGCCNVEAPSGNMVTVYLGTQVPPGSGNFTCSYAVAEDPALCNPCTQVQSCGDTTCGPCELCLGQTELPPECTPQEQCDGGEQPCGQPDQDPCPANFFCLTGCCAPIPQ